MRLSFIQKPTLGSKNILWSFTLEDATDILSRNVGKALTLLAAYSPKERVSHLLRGGSLQ